MSESKAISLDAFRKKKIEREADQPIYGILVWLYCPKCKSIEYTEIIASGGRAHRCGTQVEEVEVEVDLRAEYTITAMNLEKIDQILKKNKKSRLMKIVSKSLDKAMIALKNSEEIYLQRLQGMKSQLLLPYQGTPEELKSKLNIKETNKLGLAISEFRYQPEDRFK